MNGAQALFNALTDARLDTGFADSGTSEMQLEARRLIGQVNRPCS
jgi:hypothetical protein